MNHTQKLFSDLMREWARTLHDELQAAAGGSDQADVLEEYRDIVRTIGYDGAGATRVVEALLLAASVSDSEYAKGVCDALAVTGRTIDVPVDIGKMKCIKRNRGLLFGHGVSQGPTRGVPWTQPARDALDRAALPEALRDVPQLVARRDGACRFEIVAGGVAYGCTSDDAQDAEVMCRTIAARLETPAKLFDMQNPQPDGRPFYEATP